MPEDTYRVGLAVPRQGPSGMFGLSCRAAAHLAAEEINAAGGLAGRRLELLHVDAGAPPHHVAAALDHLLTGGAIDAVAGWHLSSVRQAVAPVVAGRAPYVYATAYEGGEHHDGVVCTGELPGEQVVAALDFLRRQFGWHRWCVVGNDYVWPRTTAARTTRRLARAGVELHGQQWIPLDCRDEETWARLVTALPEDVDGVLMLLVGADGARFNREFAAAGRDSHLVRFSPFMDETMLLASGPEATRGLFASAGWFAGLHTAAALEFTSGFARAFDTLTTGPGDQHAPAFTVPSPGTMAESTYLGLRLLADVGRRGLPTVTDLDRARSSWAWDSPHGTVELREGRARHRVHVAAATGLEFEVLAEVSAP